MFLCQHSYYRYWHWPPLRNWEKIALTISGCYDRDGHRTRLIYPDGTAVDYTYDAAGRLAAFSDWASRTTSYSYANDDRLTQVTSFNGTFATYAYDDARRLTQVWHQHGTNTVARYTYTLDKVEILHEMYAPPLNRINPISPRNPHRATFMQAAASYLPGGGR